MYMLKEQSKFLDLKLLYYSTPSLRIYEKTIAEYIEFSAAPKSYNVAVLVKVPLKMKVCIPPGFSDLKNN